jgi:hypothetical protein
VPCPIPTNPSDPPAAPFSTGSQTFNEELADGNYLVHYFAQDCAGTEELQFSQNAGGSWSTSYYTYSINVDTMAPVVATGRVLSPSKVSVEAGAPGEGTLFAAEMPYVML